MGGPGEFSSPSGGGCGSTGRQRPAEGFSIYRFSTQTRFSEDTEPGCLGLLLEIHRTAPPLKVKASRSIPESGSSSEGRGTRPRPGLGGWRRPGGGDSSNSTLGGERTESGPRFPRCLANLGVLPALAPGAPSPFSPSPDGAPRGLPAQPWAGESRGDAPPEQRPAGPPPLFPCPLCSRIPRCRWLQRCRPCNY